MKLSLILLLVLTSLFAVRPALADPSSKSVRLHVIGRRTHLALGDFDCDVPCALRVPSGDYDAMLGHAPLSVHVPARKRVTMRVTGGVDGAGLAFGIVGLTTLTPLTFVLGLYWTAETDAAGQDSKVPFGITIGLTGVVFVASIVAIVRGAVGSPLKIELVHGVNVAMTPSGFNVTF